MTNFWDADPVAPLSAPAPASQAVAAPKAANFWESDPVVSQPAPPRPVTTNQVLASAAEGVPVLGRFRDEVNADVNAALAPVVEPFLTPSAQDISRHGENFWQRRAESKAMLQKDREQFEAEHPYVDTAAKAAGGIASTVPLMAAAPAAFGLTGTVPQMVARGALSNAALGAADAIAGGEDPLKEAAMGAVTGAVAPVIGQAVGKGAELVSRLRRPAAAPVATRTIDVNGVQVPVSEGQATRDIAKASDEEIKRRGGHGDEAQAVAQDFDKQQAAAMQAANDKFASGLDPTGRVAATAPQDAGAAVLHDLQQQEAAKVAGQQARQAATAQESDALRRRLGAGNNAPTPYEAAEQVGAGVAGRRNAAVTARKRAYDAVKNEPGQFSPDFTEGFEDNLKNRLANQDVWVTPQNTPNANLAARIFQEPGRLFRNEMAPAGPIQEAVANAEGSTQAWQRRADEAAQQLMAQGVNPIRARATAAAMEGGPLAPHAVAVPGGGEVAVKPRVVEASSIRASSDPGYDASLQPRDRTRAASSAQINDMAKNLNPNRLGVSSEADRGAPIVGPDGMVESGNGRVGAIRRAYQENGDAAARYRQMLADAGVDISKYREPMLVRERTTPMTPEQRQAFAVGANKSATLSMSAPERAAADAKGITPDSLGLIKSPDLNALENRGFVRGFMQTLPAEERASLMTADGDLSSEGLARVRNAVFAKAYDDPAMLSRIAESTHDDIRSISQGLMAAAPEWASLRSAIESGRVPADLDITKDLVDAVKRTSAIRGKGIGLDASKAQMDAFNNPSQESDALQRLFYSADGKSAAPASQIGNALRHYAQEASKVDATPGLFPRTVRAADILENTTEKAGAPRELAAEVKQASAQRVEEAAKSAVENSSKVGQPLTLQELDNARKRLVALRQDAWDAARATGNKADARAMDKIMGEFDSMVIDAFNSGKFSGDAERARSLLEAARASHAQYRQTFTSRGGSDPIGRAVEKILGRYTDTAATPDQIMQLSYGSRAAPGGGQQVQVAQRLRSILGETSPEWGQYKRGLFSFLTEPEPGGKALSAVQKADRIDAFLRGSKGQGLAQVAFSREERRALDAYSRSLRASEVAPPSNSVEKTIARLTGADGGLPASTNEVLNQIIGADGQGNRNSVQLLQALKKRLPADTWNQLRQGVFKMLTSRGEDQAAYGSQALYSRLSKFLNDKGREVSQILFTKDERAQLKTIMNAHKQMIPVAGSTNPSGTAPMFAKIAGKAMHTLLPLLGFSHGGLPGAAVGMGADRLITQVRNSRAAKDAVERFYGSQPSAGATISPAIGRNLTIGVRGASVPVITGQRR